MNNEDTLFGVPYSTILDWKLEKMNELKIKPLMQYEVTYNYDKDKDVFTADTMIRDDDAVLFHRTGNLIRMYDQRFAGIVKITVTPADEVPE